ncbi:unnamed protein product [Cylindrotheca closterium]|uniref:Uncharacterized protein n=1 Tax=Cylindrotheca closterium TaxID=2856 RepID=A0AAD2PVB2_9STRA|nr:unnamed protein product [Cylindrotheca closterium]
MPPRKTGHQRHGHGKTKDKRNSDYDPPSKSMDGKVKEFGKKARALLQEEKDKRREIKVVDPVQISTKTKSSTSFGSAIKSAGAATTATARSNKRQRVSSPTKRRRSEGASSAVTSKIHIHAPHIPIPDKEFRSNVVKLHGLHASCTKDHIKKFFSGLKFDFIFTVLSNDIYIPLLDCKKDLQETRASSNNDHHLRVFVKFESSTLATVAAERSGETISIGAVKTSSSEPTKVSIGVTLMSKELARRMLEMSIHGISNAPFYEVLSKIEKELHPIISTILWKRVAKTVEVPLEEEINQHDLFRKTNHDPSTLQGYQELARHCNQLIEIHETLINQLPSPSVELLASELSSTDPSVRLTSVAATVLTNEVSQLHKILCQGRVEARIQRQTEATR